VPRRNPIGLKQIMRWIVWRFFSRETGIRHRESFTSRFERSGYRLCVKKTRHYK